MLSDRTRQDQQCYAKGNIRGFNFQSYVENFGTYIRNAVEMIAKIKISSNEQTFRNSGRIYINLNYSKGKRL